VKSEEILVRFLLDQTTERTGGGGWGGTPRGVTVRGDIHLSEAAV
jgi:hypothetical protein